MFSLQREPHIPSKGKLLEMSLLRMGKEGSPNAARLATTTLWFLMVSARKESRKK